jgi:hypothetical protein
VANKYLLLLLLSKVISSSGEETQPALNRMSCGTKKRENEKNGFKGNISCDTKD